MWYFAWILGLPLAAGFAVLNGIWFELMEEETLKKQEAASGQLQTGEDGDSPG
jgi:cytochrome bd-I ubiquinol oxidase subunit X